MLLSILIRTYKDLVLTLFKIKSLWLLTGCIVRHFAIIFVCLVLKTFCIQLFRERLSEKVYATITKGIVGGFEFAVLQRNLKEWHKRPWTYVCAC